ncbi:Acetyltransferase (GNAT) family protein [Rhizobium tibeticum]|uniref:Acetyltransferase (GNAT) family protein n=1 Tax=Rhizobium tibeticum TaxID=501024 RepID=A0A1H8LIT6_9HYPH|nr:Acetyltransferase (GNAT) family protein [Rhizobium tibeticum]SEO05081.1 Acetyltransferase (GNAT) family protein [Rhizobium tibeticum]
MPAVPWLQILFGIMGLSRQRASKMAHRAMLIIVFVCRGERGGGCAKSQLDATVDYARGNGIRQLELAVSGESMAAIRFYEREGFHEAGRTGGIMHDSREIDDVMMVRRIEDYKTSRGHRGTQIAGTVIRSGKRPDELGSSGLQWL